MNRKFIYQLEENISAHVPMDEAAMELTPPTLEERQEWMGLLAKADSNMLHDLWESVEARPAYRVIRKPEIGSIMTRGRMSGGGRPFNLGEMTVTRCAVDLDGEDGIRHAGHSYIAGRRPQHAEIAAVLDAMLQAPKWHDVLKSNILTPLKTMAARRKADRAAKVAQTKVDFFTLVRGENE